MKTQTELKPKEPILVMSCESCRKNPSTQPHICPYKEDINGDIESLCNCCDDCQNICCDDI